MPSPGPSSPLRISYPDELPISARRDDLLETIERHQVLVVAGETGSGKSTQLPKLCLELGRGVDALIGHTQPRRVAARTIAARVADELGVELGREVGYSVRFDDQVAASTRVRVMTDGVLLAELRRDRMLRRYDTLIIDEAHERSLNIDFLLGYLAQLLPQRPDLKLIVTSATIDTARFARHFATTHPDGSADAPVVEVSGRTYPVEVRYRPLTLPEPELNQSHGAKSLRNRQRSRSDERDLVQAICDAVDELSKEGPGDVLVFVSGEREIHDAADALRRLERPGLEVLPLYARLSAGEQARIFQPHSGRRVVLSTNVAETSITVPGVRYVVDAGTARISRYSRRLKVQRLPIEPISKASADQRAGRCGRVAPGICIRLYDEEDYEERPDFTEPEILRTNLASVILQMASIGLGDVAAFPFVEPPDRAAVRDGEQLLEELGAFEAVDHRDVGGDRDHQRGRDDRDDRDDRRLTPIGRRLARLPIDPRLGRMVLAAAESGCVREVMVIAAALSIRDPRERPEEHRQAADELHRRFDVEGSDLLSLVALWDHLRREQRARSTSGFRRMCRAEYLNYVRVREWQDLYSQLRRAAGEVGVRPSTEVGHPDHVHRAVLAGHLSHIGAFDRQAREYVGARGSRFVIAPGSVLARKRARWVMAAELVETDRLRARRVAVIRPEWAEQLGAHLVRRSYGEPWWDAERSAAVTSETVTLYGLPIVEGRVVLYDRVDPAGSRELFVRHALVAGEWSRSHAFIEHNRRFVERVESLEQRARRSNLLDEDTLAAFYDERVPAEITTGRRFDRWWDRRRRSEPNVFDLTEADVLGHVGADPADYPDVWRHGDDELPLTYRFDPGSPLDGVTVEIPIAALNRITADGFDWHVPGYRAELVAALVRSLPKSVRRQLIPLADTVAAVTDRMHGEEPSGRMDGEEPSGRLVDAVARVVTEVTGVRVAPEQFDPTTVEPYLRVTFVVYGVDGEVLDAGEDLAAIRSRQASTLRDVIADAAPIDERVGMVTWEVGAIPSVVESARGASFVRGFPALLDDGDSVSLRVLSNPDLQARVMRGGVRRLLVLTAAPSTSRLLASAGTSAQLALAGSGFDATDLAADAVAAAIDRVMADRPLPWDEESFVALQQEVRGRAPAIAEDAFSAAVGIVAVAATLHERLDAMTAGVLVDTVTDARRHLERLVRPRFVVVAGTARLPDVMRYVRGVEYRLDRLAGEVPKDHRRMSEVVPLERRYARLLSAFGTSPVPADVVEFGWDLEDLRIAVFAQPLASRGGAGISVKRLTQRLTTLESRN